MTGPDPRHLEAEARGRGAAKVLEAARGIFEGERRRIERSISRAFDDGSLSSEGAMAFCAQLDAIVRLERQLEALVRSGEVASKRLAAALDDPKNETL